MKVLAIEAAASPATVALLINGEVLECQCETPQAQAEQLLPLADQLLVTGGLTLGALDGIAVGRGPGSFTGLRVAAAMAQGLAYSAGLSIANVSSLAAVAHQVSIDQQISYVHGEKFDTSLREPSSVLVCMDARKSQVYCALYEMDELAGVRLVSSEVVLDPHEVVKQFKSRAYFGAGNGFAEYAALAELELAKVLPTTVSAGAIARRAASGAVKFDSPYLATPHYVRDNVTHGS